MVEVSYDQLTFSFSVTFPDVLQHVKQPRWDSSHQPTRTDGQAERRIRKRKKKTKQTKSTTLLSWADLESFI